MKYMGSKRKIAAELKNIIEPFIGPRSVYVEPFVGGANMLENFNGARLGCDRNEWVVSALEFIRDQPLPKDNKEFSENDYNACRLAVREGRALPFDKGLVGYALIAFSFGAIWCGGWSRGKKNDGSPRDYVAESYRACMAQKEKLQNAVFLHSEYQNIPLTQAEECVIYCDPPYYGTSGYGAPFDHSLFWQWCRDTSRWGARVFISEYTAPDDFQRVWHRSVKVRVPKVGIYKDAVEALFTYEA